MKKARVVAGLHLLALLGGPVLLLLAFTTPSTPARHPTPATGNVVNPAVYVYDPHLGGASSGVPNVTAVNTSNAGSAGSCNNNQAIGVYDDGGAVGVNCFDIVSNGPVGAWSVEFFGLVAEGANGQGAYATTGTGIAVEKFRNVVCTCRVAGTAGTNGIFVELFADGGAVNNCELVGIDGDACNDTAGTVLRCDMNVGIIQGANYTLQFKSTTDCAANPTDCACNVTIER